MSALTVTCSECGTAHELGNGQICPAEKRGHVHHLGHCPKCNRKTWSEPFVMKPFRNAPQSLTPDRISRPASDAPTVESFSVYTVGHEVNYDKGIAEHGKAFKKLGRHEDYPGGFAVRTPEDAERLIDERGKRGEWAVYALDADWDKDTVPSKNGWWHALVNSSLIVRKIPSPDRSSQIDQPAPLKERWCVHSRVGWCGVKGGHRPRADIDNVKTQCGMWVTLPWGTERRVPTCPDCIKVNVEKSQRNHPEPPCKK